MEVTTDLGQIYFVKKGNGSQTMIWWPSILTDHRIYDPLVSAFEERYQLILIDGPGHGKSSACNRFFTLGECTEILVKIIDTLNIGSACVGGTCQGGMVAGECALQLPQRVRSLIMMNTPFDTDAQKPGFMSRFITFGARWLLSAQFFRNGVANTFFTQSILKNNPEYRAHFHEMLKNANPDSISKAVCSVIMRASPLRDRLSEIKIPALVIAGESDARYPVALQESAAERLVQGQFFAVPGKHISIIESPSQVTQIIKRFLDTQKI